MKKLLKILMFIVLALVIVIGITAAVINAKDLPTYEVEKIEYTASADSAGLARGKKFVTLLCAGCHLNTETGTLSGKRMEDAPEFGDLYAQNITNDKEFGIGDWTDGEILYLLRTGVLPNGRYAPPYMAKLPHMSDEDLNNIIAFLRSDDELVKATNTADQPCEPSFLTKALCRVAFKPLPFPNQPIKTPAAGDKLALGKYLTINLDCWTCHSPSFEKLNVMEPEKTPGFLSGGNQSLYDKDRNQVVSLNITPDKETGIGNWTEEQFIKATKYGILPEGHTLQFPMEPYTELTDEEAAAIFAYLKTVPAVSNKVERKIYD